VSKSGDMCPNCGRISTGKLHCSVEGQDFNFCDELCVISFSRRFPRFHITIIEGFCEHGDEDYEGYLAQCKKCGAIRSVR